MVGSSHHTDEHNASSFDFKFLTHTSVIEARLSKLVGYLAYPQTEARGFASRR